MGESKLRWSYSTGEKGRNRVRAFEHASGVLMLEFYEQCPGQSQPKRVRLSLGHRDQEKAKQQADEAAAKLGRMEALKPEELTLQELFDIYGGEVTPDKALTTQDHDKAAAKLFLRCFGPNRKAKDLSRRDWDRFIRERLSGRFTGSAVGPRTVARDLKWLLAVLNWATMAGDGRGGFLLERNPLKGLDIPKEESPKRPILSQERYKVMLDVADRIGWRFNVALILVHETGHRIGAVRQLRWSDVDLERGVIRWRKSSDKIGMEHETPLTEEALEAFEEARKHNPGIGDAWVFPAPKNASEACRKDLMTKLWKRAEKLAGLEPIRWLGWHGLRRRFATDLKQIPLRDLCDLGGWKDPDTVVKCYQTADEEDLRRAITSRTSGLAVQ